MQEEREREGIPVEPGLLQEMQAWSQTLGVKVAFEPRPSEVAPTRQDGGNPVS
jgi:hypothetical protein